MEPKIAIQFKGVQREASGYVVTFTVEAEVDFDMRVFVRDDKARPTDVVAHGFARAHEVASEMARAFDLSSRK